MSGWNPRANEIFLAAVESPDVAQRQALLEEQCGSDGDLRAQVESLLAASDHAGSFLEHPAIDGPPTVRTDGDSRPTVPSASTDRTQLHIDDVSLDFLSPCDTPGVLGRLGTYEVTDVVGRGGMGIVLKARDRSLNRVVAIKVLAPELGGNATARKRFLREARAAAAIRNDHVVTIYAVHDGAGANPSALDHRPSALPYLVMEFIDGQSLQAKIDAAGQLDLKETLRIGVQVAAGLAAAHAHGVIHRDIKPSNILLENGVERVRITDFGLARAADDVEITRPGEVAGTPQYMSPEQAQGQPVDARSDLFSFGCVLYAMCTGRPPFRAESTIAAIRRVCDDTPRPIREVNPDTPAWLTEIIDRLLAKRPEDRYQTAAEVVELLGQHLAQVQHPGSAPRPVVLPSPHWGEGPGVRGRAHPRWAAALLLLAALTALGVTEATGVTRLAGTVVRIVTGEGTLVIEVDDPSVQVSLDGEELTISGGGVEQVRLRPGQYQFTATKHGQPVKRELVTITRGGERVVTVSREAVERTTAVPQPSVERGAFVVLGGEGVPERKFDTLAEAVLGASVGDTIEVRGNGPIVTQPIRIAQALTIRAGEGFRPVIKAIPEHSEAHVFLLQADAPLVLEGLEFHRMAPEQKEGDPWRILLGAELALRAANCRFVERNVDACILTNSAACELRNCELLCPDAGQAVLADNFQSGQHLAIDNCLLTKPCSVHCSQSGVRDGNVRLARSTFRGPIDAFGIAFVFKDETPQHRVLRVDASRNLFDSQMVSLHVFPPTGNVPREAEQDYLGQVLAWNGERNVYAPVDALLRLAGEGREGHQPAEFIKNLADWRTFWGNTDTESIEGSIRYQGGDLLARLAAEPGLLTPDDFRLRPDSPGYRAGPDGKDLGADIDLVGPGPAYERWKQTPDYQQWLEETGQMK